MHDRFLSILLATTALVASPFSAPAIAGNVAPAPVADLVAKVDIPYEQFTLSNGLRVVVHTDRKAPIVAVSIWYHVGSKDEPAGKTGFAHLFEHLMFNGSEHAPGDYFAPMKQIGATDMNGTTWFDRTNYYQSVPTGALETALFLEAIAWVGWWAVSTRPSSTISAVSSRTKSARETTSLMVWWNTLSSRRCFQRGIPTIIPP